jgi:Cu-Zn family superoxide dismutase
MKNRSDHRITTDLRRRALAGAVTAALLVLVGCGGAGDDQRTSAAASDNPTPQHTATSPDAAQADVTRAVAVLEPTAGNEAHGKVELRTVAGGVEITAEITGLEPGSTHGFHIHQYGDVSAADGTAAGGHYNPEGFDHALPTHSPRHAGDLGNLQADDDGVARRSIVVDNLTIAGRQDPVLGRAVILHAGPDDGSQPTGGAGARIAQGVIGVADPAGTLE